MGLKLTKIHRAFSFNEEAWLKPYIEWNTQLRTKATNDFEKDFFQTDEQFSIWKNYGKYPKSC